ncbi:MAG: hypothetical protein IJF83_03025 [Methanobrevibacter sp.]|nr:hypothetical protein [Methanobrevibacter sp.]
MLLQIIQLLLISLGFHNTNNNTPKSLYPQQRYTQPQPVSFQVPPLVLLVLFAAGIIVFVVFVFMFVPGNESTLVYNQFDNII